MSAKILSIVFGNLVSKGLGVFREVLFAAWFGTGDTAAAFRIAQTGFLMPTHSIIGDTLGAGLLPLYQKLRRDGGDSHRVLVLAATLYGVLFSCLITTAILLYAEFVASLIAPGASSSALDLAAYLMRILGLATPFYVFSGMLSYLETAYGRYNAIAWRPSLLNIGSTIGVGLAAWFGQTHWLATCLLLAHVGFFLWSLVTLLKLDQIIPARFPVWSTLAGVCSQLFRNSAPLLALPLIAQSNVLVERITSSWIGTSVISSVDYARLINDTAVQLIGVPLGVLVMAQHGGSKPEEVRSHIIQAASLILLLAVPTGIFVGVNATSITRLLFERGAFDERSVAITSQIVTWMSAALASTVLAYYLIKALNAQLRNLEALVGVFIGSSVNIVVNLALWDSIGPATIGISAAVGNLSMLLFVLLRLQLIRSLMPFVAWLLFGSTLAFAGGKLIASTTVYPLDLLAGSAFAGFLWLSMVVIIPRFNVLMWPVVKKAFSR